jgi:carboxyl-terminal processing protease
MIIRRFIGPFLVASSIVTPLLGTPAWGEAKAPSEDERKAAQIVGRLMERGHISRHKVDDEISQRMFKAYLRIYDPLKLYFLQSDVDEFQAQSNKLDDDIKGSNAAPGRAADADVPRMNFAFDVYNRFLQRLDESIVWANEFADAEHDFNKEESIVVDPKSAEYAKTSEEAKERWRARIKYELLTFIVDGKTLAEARERIHKRYRNLKTRWHELDSGEVVEMYLSTLTSSFDPHSTYMSPEMLEDFEIHMRLSLEGIGALLQSEDGTTVVKEIVPGGAAEKDGRIKPGDQIVGVAEGDKGEIEDIMDMKLRDVVKRIRGKAGTTVRLEVIPDGQTEHVTYNLIRQRIELQDQAAKGDVIEFNDPATGAIRKIGVINLPSFYADQGEGELFGNGQDPANLRTATNDVRKILEDFKAKGVDGVVMDLRVNGGGLLTEAINLTGLFITEGPIVQVRDFDNKVFRHPDNDKGTVAYNGPLVVLISRFSASASEIFAGAIKDYGRGIVVGDKTTHGKGTVQKVLDLKRQAVRPGAYGALKLTMQQFYRVNGESTQNKGVPSDVVLPSRTDNDDFGEASLDYALEYSQIDPASYTPSGRISPEVVTQLRELSKERFQKDADLEKLSQKKARFDERKSRKVLTFNEESLKKERAEFKEEKEIVKDKDGNDVKKKESTDASTEDEETLLSTKKNEKFGTDPYSKEVLQITSDFIRLQGRGVAADAAKAR